MDVSVCILQKDKQKNLDNIIYFKMLKKKKEKNP